MASQIPSPKGSSLKPNMYGLGISMPLVATAAVFLRFQTRLKRKIGLGPDDWTILIALVFTYALSLTMLVDAGLGLDGDHATYYDSGLPKHVDKLVFSLKVVWVGQFISVLALGICKISVLLLYRKIFIGRGFRLLNAVMLALTAVWTISFFFANLFDCIPIKANWDSTTYEGCVDVKQLFFALCISDIILDVLILTLPWRQVWKLQMPRRQKVLICGIFLLGGFVVGASVARFVVTTRSLNYQYDTPYEVAPTSYWQVIEACIGILCACLPTLRPILSNIRLPFFKPLLESLRKKASSTQLRSKQSLPTSTIRHVSSARSLFAKRSASESGDGGSPRERASDEPMPSLPMPRHEMV